MGSLLKKYSPFSFTVIEVKSLRSWGALVEATGNFTGTPWFFTMERETIMNVASKKNMMSISGMISIRARRVRRGAGIFITRQAPGSAQDQHLRRISAKA